MPDEFDALGAVPESDYLKSQAASSGDPFASLGGVSEDQHKANLIAAPDFDAPMHAAQNPGQEDLAYQVEKARSALPFSQKVKNTFTDAHPWDATKRIAGGMYQWGKGLLYDLPQAKLDQSLAAMRGDNADALTAQAEGTLAAQKSEQGLDSMGHSISNFMQPAYNAAGMIATGAPVPQDQQEAASRANFDARVQDARNQIQLAQGRPLDTGFVAGIYKTDPIGRALATSTGQQYEAAPLLPSQEVGPEALQAAGAQPVNQEKIDAMAAAADPKMIAMSAAPMLPGAQYIGGRLTQGLGKAMQLPGRLLDAIPGKAGSLARSASVTGATAALAEGAIHAPVATAKVAAAVGAAKGIQGLGKLFEEQGAEAATGAPSTLSQQIAERRLREARGETVPGSGALENIGREVGQAPVNALSTAAGMLPLNIATSDGDGKKLAESTAGAAGFGAVLGAMHSNRPALVEALRPYLRYQGSDTLAQAPNQDLAQKTADFLETQPEDVRNHAYEMMGAMQGLDTQSKSGVNSKSQFAILSDPDYQAEIQKINGPTANDGGRGVFVDNSGTVYINGDLSGSQHTLGHESSHLAEAILRGAGQKGSATWQSMVDAVGKGLMVNGKPTPEFSDFIDKYNKAFDPNGYDPKDPSTWKINPNVPDAIDEFLAEHAGRITSSEGTDFALPKSLGDKIRENFSRYTLGALGIDSRKIGQQTSFLNEHEMGLATKMMRDTLAQVAHAPRGSSESDQVQQPPPAAPGPNPPPSPAETPETPAAASPDPRQAAGIDPAEVDAMKNRAADDAENAMIRARGRRKVSPETDAQQRQNVRDQAAQDIDDKVDKLAENLDGSTLQHPLHDAILQNEFNEDDGGYKGWIERQGSKPPKATTEDPDLILDEPRPEDPQPGEFGISPAQKRILKSQGWGDDAIEQMPIHQVEALTGANPAEETPETQAVASKGGALANIKPKAQNEQGNAGVQASTQTAVQEPALAGVSPVSTPQRNPVVPETDQVAKAKAKYPVGTSTRKSLDVLDANRGKVVWVKNYNSAQKAQSGFGEEERTNEIAKQGANKRKAGQVGTAQDKPFIPTEIRVNKNGDPYFNGFDVDVMMSNLRHVSDFMRDKKIENPMKSDSDIERALTNYNFNHNNGFEGSGLSRMAHAGPDYRMPTDNPDAEPIPLATKPDGSPDEEKSQRIADMLNMAVNSKVKDLHGDEADKAIALNLENRGFRKGVETNQLRSELEKHGFDTDKNLSKRSAFYGRLSTDLIKGGVATNPESVEGKSVRPHGFDIDLQKAFQHGKPQFEAVAAGFMPRETGDPTSYGTKMPEDDLRAFRGRMFEKYGVGSTSALNDAEKAEHEQLIRSIDWRTGRRTLIPSGRLTPDQSEAAAQAIREHYRSYNDALEKAKSSGSDEDFGKVADSLPKANLSDIGLEVDPGSSRGIVIADGEEDPLKFKGAGGESITYGDEDHGVAYKVMHPGVSIFSSKPEGIGFVGGMHQKQYGDNRSWDLKYENGNIASALEKMHILGNVGGIPSELVGMTDEGALIFKQPLYPTGKLNKEKYPRGGYDAMRETYKNAQLEPISEDALATGKVNASAGKVAVVDGKPYLISDLTGTNHNVDNQGDLRITDFVHTPIPPEMLKDIPGLEAQVERMKQAEGKERSKVAFMPSDGKDTKTYEDTTSPTREDGALASLRGQDLHSAQEGSADTGAEDRVPANAPGDAPAGAIPYAHWGRRAGLDELDPSKHGTGIPGAEARRKKNNADRYVPRTYVGIGDYKREPALPPNKYTGSLDPSLIYDAAKDPLDLISLANKAVENDGFKNRTTEFERLIKDHGFLGYKSGNVAALFHKIPTGEHVGPGEFAQSAPDYAKRSPEMMRTLRDYVPDFEDIKHDYFNAKPADEKQVSKQNEIANDYENAKTDNLSNENVRRAYDALASKVADQYDDVLKGIDVEPWADKQNDGSWKGRAGQPYKSSADMQKDMRENKHLYFLTTTPDTFGSSDNFSQDHPMMQDSGKVSENGYKLLNNDALRAVHDAIAHGSFGLQFGPAGEEAAWRAHMATIQDPWARWALTTETRGQNSWVNYRNEYLNSDGSPKKKGDAGYVAPPDRPFADQKTDLLPAKWVLTGDRAVDKAVTTDPEFRKASDLGDETIRSADGKFMPSAPSEDDELNLGKKFTKDAFLQQSVKRRIKDIESSHPEAIVPDYKKEDDGKYRVGDNGLPVANKESYDLDSTPLAKSAAKGIRGDEKRSDAISSAYADKLVDEYKSVQDRKDIMAGKDWYSLARDAIGKHFGDHALLFAQLLGATSARTPARENFQQALEAYNMFRAGDYDGKPEKYLDLEKKLEAGEDLRFPQTYSKQVGNKQTIFPSGTEVTPSNFKFFLDSVGVLPKKGNNKEYNANSLQVLRVLAGNWEQKVGGPKTPNFARNLSGQGENPFAATIDVWAARNLHRLGNLDNKGRWRILPESEPGVADKDFFLGQDAYDKAAKQIGIQPDELQAVMWFAEKSHWQKKGWTRGAGAELSDFNTMLDKLGEEIGKLGKKKVIKKAEDPQGALSLFD